MKVLVIGSGGREHALVRAIRKSPLVQDVLAAPGSDGMSLEASCHGVSVENLDGLLELAREQKVDLTVVGPEVPLSLGIVDRFEQAGLKIFGPRQRAAVLESSKVFTKNFLKKYKIPTARYEVFEDFESAKKFLHENSDTRWVLKIDGLAAGKGVFIPQDFKETLAVLQDLFVNESFGRQPVVIEEFLDGEELSFMALCDGAKALPLASSQDHKRLLDQDQGPNTGGMGAYSPAPILTPDLEEKIIRTILQPTLDGMRAEDRPFCGVLYAGLMICGGEPYVLEYNVRFGDPEAEVLLPRLESDWVDLFLAAISGTLDQQKPRWRAESAVCVVLAAEGYPNAPTKGDKISGLEEAQALGEVYHAGTKKTAEGFVANGGRVLTLSALGKDLRSAVDRAYQMVDRVQFRGRQYRRDIAFRGLKNS